jgi:type I restriction enzyme M protein
MKPASARPKPAARGEPNSQAQCIKTMPNDERPNMRVTQIFDRSASDHLLEPLDQAEFAALEAILFEKNDRLYFRCPVRNKDILAKPEEAVRQLWILRLTRHYGYPINRLAV